MGRLLGGPAWTWVADRLGPDRILRWAAISAALCGLALLLARSPWLLALTIAGWSLSRAPLFPIMDASTIHALGRGYGPIRATGSVAFLLAALAGGLLRDRVSDAPLLLAVGLLWLTAAVSLALPPLQATPQGATHRPWRALVLRPGLGPLVGGCLLHGATLSTYDQLFAMHVDAMGLPAAATGGALALGVGVEIGILTAAPWLLQRLGPRALLLLGVASGVPRSLITGTTHSPTLLVATQALHGLHFGAFWVAGTTLFAGVAPPQLRNSTQALLPAAAFGAGPLLGLSLASAVLRHGDTQQLYLCMAAISALATLALLWAPRPSAPSAPSALSALSGHRSPTEPTEPSSTHRGRAPPRGEEAGERGCSPASVAVAGSSERGVSRARRTHPPA